MRAHTPFTRTREWARLWLLGSDRQLGGRISDINVLIVADGIFNLSTTYPVASTGAENGPDPRFTLSHLISTLSNSASPTFSVDTASRGFNAPGTIPDNITNATADPNATIKGADPSNPTPFHFDDPDVDLSVYDEIWQLIESARNLRVPSLSVFLGR